MYLIRSFRFPSLLNSDTPTTTSDTFLVQTIYCTDQITKRYSKFMHVIRVWILDFGSYIIGFAVCRKLSTRSKDVILGLTNSVMLNL